MNISYIGKYVISKKLSIPFVYSIPFLFYIFFFFYYNKMMNNMSSDENKIFFKTIMHLKKE